MGWFSKAQSVLQRKQPKNQPPEPEHFRVHCGCGYSQEGVRTEEAQQIPCPDCGTELFVLPRNVYPKLAPTNGEVKSGKGAKKKPAKKSPQVKQTGGEDAVEVEVVVPGKVQETIQVEVLEEGDVEQKRDSRLTSTVTGVASATKERTVRLARSGMSSLRQAVTPFRLVVVGMAALLLGTVFYMSHRQRMEQAQIDFRTASEAGGEKLKSGDVTGALFDFRKAEEARQKLGREDGRAQGVRQTWRELEAMQTLSTASVVEIVEEAEEHAERSDLSGWKGRFETIHQGRWLIVDTMIRREKTSLGRDEYLAEVFWLTKGGRGVKLKLELPELKQLVSGTSPRRVVFAVAWESCELSADRKHWICKFDSKSGFLWVHSELLKLAGVDVEEGEAGAALKTCLQEQAELAGVSL